MAAAGPTTVDILTTTQTTLITTFSEGYSHLHDVVNWLTGSLLGIEIVLLGLFWALNGGEQIVAVIKKLLYIGFWLWVVNNFPALVNNFVGSMVKAGTIAGGSGGPSDLLNPSEIFSYGFLATEPLVKQLGDIGITEIFDAIVYGLSYLVIILCFAVLAIQVVLATVEFYLITAMAGVLLPFGFFGPTKFLAEKAIGSVIGQSVKLMVLAFLIAVIKPTLANIQFQSVDRITFGELFSVLGICLLMAYLAWQIPALAGSLLSGSPSLSAGSAAQNAVAGAAMGGAAVAATAALTRQAVNAGGHVAAGGARAAGVVAGGAKMGAATSTGGMASQLMGGIAGAAKAAGSALVQSTAGRAAQGAKGIGEAAARNFRTGQRSAFTATGGTMSDGAAKADQADRGGKSVVTPPNNNDKPDWAQRAKAALRNLPQEASPAGGSVSPSLGN